MNIISSIPNAPCLVESMRSLGYSFETAIADLIDNCISAKAKHIKIIQKPSDDPELIIFDDGLGMSDNELEEALRFGSKNPNEQRDDDDLGRYGLGMKSASLSQCRQLIVASKKDGKISCYSWDIDVIIENNDWSVIKYDEDDISRLPDIRLLDLVECGTYVLLRKFDRIAESSDDIEMAMQECLSRTREHLSLVFHRIMSEDGVRIDINGNMLEPMDPFLEYHHGTQPLPEETIMIDGQPIKAKPFILPHMNSLSDKDLAKVGGKEDLRANQGFYIYRCKRLIIWGTWFRLESKREINKLARVRVDIPNSLDSIWDIDVKKSTATIPQKIRSQLANTITSAILRSGTVIGYRGEPRDRTSDCTYIWERETNRDGDARYRINREHQQIQLLYSSLDKEQQRLFEVILSTIENGLLVGNLYADAASDKIQKIDLPIDDLISSFNMCIDLATKGGMEQDAAISLFLKQEPFINCKDFEKEWRRNNE